MIEEQTVTDLFQIIVLDDNASTRNLAKCTLERHLNCVTRVCSNASDLFKLSEQSQPDLFLLDVDLDDENSLEICQNLRSNPETGKIPIVFLSKYDGPEKRVAALKAGGVDYLDKPFYPEELVTRIKNHLEIHRLQLNIQNQVNEQRALLRVLCHDLVNPIFAAQSLLSLRISNGKMDTPAANRILGCCNTALDLITHVRDENVLVSKNKQFTTEIVSVADAIKESVKTLSNRFHKKGVKLVAKADPNAKISTNRIVLVHNILNNLITNALKFSYPKGEVQLHAYIQDDTQCVIEVIDDGIGMPPEILENLFEENAKVSRSGTCSEKGTGFGMPLVKRYVEKNSGTIEVESSERQESQDGCTEGGTTVRLRFPNHN